jgi:ADP-ribosylation factor-binding protein GGA
MLRRGDSLESLLQVATNPDNAGPAMTAVESFANSVNETADGARIAVRLLATKIQSQHEWEAMQALHVLEFCMQMCAKSGFVSEVAKFRFLNEMIKLVSPKYLGNRTPPSVKTRVLEMLFTWTHLYSSETKIQEAYDMLRKQGVITEDHVPSACTIVPPRQPDKSSVFEDDEKARLLRRLLQSKHPDDLQAANRLIKSMVKEDEKRSEKHSKVLSTLEQVQNNSQLLAEMLAHYDTTGTSSADVELMAELHQACKQLRPSLSHMAEECDDTVLQDIVQASDELNKVLENYDKVIIQGEKLAGQGQVSLLDLASPSENVLSEPISNNFSELSISNSVLSDADQLREVFNTTIPNASLPSQPSVQGNKNLLLPLTPLVPETTQVDLNTKVSQRDYSTVDSNLFSSKAVQKNPVKDPLKSLDLDFLVQNKITEGLCKKNPESSKKSSEGIKEQPEIGINITDQSGSKKLASSEQQKSLGDDALLDIGGCIQPDIPVKHVLKVEEVPNDDSLLDMDKPEVSDKPEMLPKVEQKPVDCKALLLNLNVTLESIKASSKPPLTVLDQSDGIVVTLHLAQNSPRPGVYVVVVSIQSRVTQIITNLTFQAVIPDKSCKLRLQPPSSTDLNAFNPFLPPPAATQLLLIANPNGHPVSLKFMISYCVDGDMVTEMGEVEQLSFEH